MNASASTWAYAYSCAHALIYDAVPNRLVIIANK